MINDYDILDKLLPRYLRVTSCSEAYIKSLITRNPFIARIRWNSQFLAFPGCYSLSEIDWITSKSYKEVGVFPMDISSSLAIVALGIDQESSKQTKLLDLCCSPGAKFQLVSELLRSQDLLVGVDISLPRIEVCKVLLSNSFNAIADRLENSSETSLSAVFPRQLIFQCDGTVFGPDSLGSVQYDSSILFNEIFHGNKNSSGDSKRRRVNKSARTRERKALKATQDSLCGIHTSDTAADDNDNTTVTLQGSELTDFDFVLVDAECTHDASYRHMRYINNNNNNSISANNCDGDIDITMREIDSETFTLSKGLFTSGVSKPNASLSHTTASSCTSSSNVVNIDSSTVNIGSNGTANDKASDTVDKLRTLQRGLLLNGFSRLAVGGTLVYSTCSQEEEQNEKVVQWLLDSCPGTASLVPIQFDCKDGTDVLPDVVEGGAANSALKAPSELLSLSLPEIVCYSSALTTSDLTALSSSLCKYFCVLNHPQLEPSLLTGTVRVGYKGGMSGHFIAKVKKIGK